MIILLKFSIEIIILRKIITKIISLLSLTAVAPVFAERPLTIEGLTTDKNRFKLYGNISYFNQFEHQIATENYNLNNSENLQLTAMSEQDMQNTQGAWSISHNLMFGATLGGIGGHYG